LTGNPETAIVVTHDFVEKIILSIFNGYCVCKDVLPTILSTFLLKFMGQSKWISPLNKTKQVFTDNVNIYFIYFTI